MLACRPMLPLALAVAAGALAGRFFPAFRGCVPAGAVLFAAALAWFVLRPGKAAPAAPESTPPAYAPHILPVPGFIARRGLNAFLMILCVGCFFLAAWRQGGRHERVSPERAPSGWADAVLVADGPNAPRARAGGRWRAAARVLSLDGEALDSGIPVRLYGSARETFRRGDRIRARIRLSGPRPEMFPGAFDSAFWLERDGLAAYANAARGGGGRSDAFAVIPVETPSPLVRLRRIIDSVRAAAVEKTLALGGEHGPMLAAMLYGYRDELDRGLNDAFRRVGIGHVLAISGLHVGLVIGLLWWLGGWLPWSSRGRSLACLAAAVVYLGLSGGQVAAARATLMAVIHLGARACGRRGDMLNSLGAAAFLIILHNPTAPLDVSFQLSFTAVVFIHIALGGRRRDGPGGGPLPEVPSFRRQLRERIVSLARLSLATWIGLYPIAASVFHQVNPAGLPINIVVIPVMGAVLAGGLLLPALGWIPGAASVLTAPSRALTRIALEADALPYSSLAVHSPPWQWMAVFYGFVFLYLLHRMIGGAAWRRRWLAVCACGIAAGLAGVTAGMRSSPPPRAGRLSLLPGAGLGVVAAETPDGAIALVGRLRRQGLDEAGWLHYLRRSGSVSVVAIGRGRSDALEGLAFHYPPVAQENLPLTSKREANAAPAWRSVAGAPGVEYALVRNARGRATGLAVRTDGALIATASRPGAEDAAALDALLRKGAEEGRTAYFSPGRAEGGAVVLENGRARVYDGGAWRDTDVP